VVGPTVRDRLEMSGSEEKLMAMITMLERGCCMKWMIHIALGMYNI
jgi:hypothetical protein